VACRFVESKWRCWSTSGREDSDFQRANPKDPFYDWASLPPYLDYQIASIIIHRILTPLRKDVLRDLQATLNVHSSKDWYVTFLTAFILLQNYEMQMDFQRQFAARRQAKVSKPHDATAVTPSSSGTNDALGPILGHASGAGDQLGRENHPSPFPLLLQGSAAVQRGIRLGVAKGAKNGPARSGADELHGAVPRPGCEKR